MKDSIKSLLADYHRVELLFQRGSFDKCVINMRDKNKDKINDVVSDVLSYAAVSKKNIAVVKLIVCLHLLAYISKYSISSLISELFSF